MYASAALVAGLVVLLAEVLGLVSAIGFLIDAQYYAWGTTRQTGERVVLVEADDATVAKWGPPPWSVEQRASLLSVLRAGRPSVIVETGRERLFEGVLDEAPDVVAVRSADLAASWTGTGETVEVGRLEVALEGVPREEDLPPRTLADVVARTALPIPDEGPLPVHFLSPPSALPRLPLHRVADGDLPSDVFTGRIVVVGLTARTFAVPVRTPVGPLSVAEVEAHALLAVSDGVVWHLPGTLAQALWVVGMALAGLACLRTSRGPVGGWLLAGALVLLVALDFTLFRLGLARLGLVRVLFGVATVAVFEGVGRHRETLARLATLRRQVREVRAMGDGMDEGARPKVSVPAAGSTDANAVAEAGSDDGATLDFWRDLAELGRTYVRVPCSSIVAELASSGHHVEFRGYFEVRPEDVIERRRDIRRSPFRPVYLTHRSAWADDLVRGARSLLVPLHHHGELEGIWLLNVQPDVEFETCEIRLMEGIGRRMAEAMARRRSGLPEAQVSPEVTADLAVITHEIQALFVEKAWAEVMLERLPVPLLVATIWGTLEFTNRAMRMELERDFPEGVPNQDLRAIVSRMTGCTLEEAHAMMNRAVREGDTVELAPEGSGGASQARQTFSLVRVTVEPDEDSEGGRADVPYRLLLIAGGEAAEGAKLLANVVSS